MTPSTTLGAMPTAMSRCGRPAAPAGLPSRHERRMKTFCGARRSMPPPAAVAAAAAGGGGLVDPSASGPRRVVVPQTLDPSLLEDVRKAEAFGPRGLLLVGMGEAGCSAVQAWFGQMEPGFVVSPCPATLLAAGTLRQAIGGTAEATALPARAWEAPPADAPPVAFFSGLSGEEQVALMEGWSEHTGLDAPAFASVTPAILDKPLSRLLADIVRAQAQQPPPGHDPETLAAVRGAPGSAPAATAGGGAGGGAGDDAAAAGPGGEQALRSKLADYVMLDREGQAQTAPMSLEALKEQIQDKVRAKKAAQAVEERRQRKEEAQDETDRLRQALRSGKAGKKQQAKGRKAGGGFGG
ncbi:hypothetical protein ABPG75_001435 [Micractinium tetrahymenae]